MQVSTTPMGGIEMDSPETSSTSAEPTIPGQPVRMMNAKKRQNSSAQRRISSMASSIHTSPSSTTSVVSGPGNNVDSGVHIEPPLTEEMEDEDVYPLPEKSGRDAPAAANTQSSPSRASILKRVSPMSAPKMDSESGTPGAERTWSASPVQLASTPEEAKSSFLDAPRQAARKVSSFASIFLSRSEPSKPSPTGPNAPRDAVDLESDFVLSRLETVSLDSNASASTTSWLTGQLQSTYASIRDTVIGETAQDSVDWDFWGKLVTDYESTIRKQPRYFTQQLSRGIPDSLRGLMWQLMCKGKSDRYSIMYASLLTRSSKDEKLIIRDLARTFPTHPHFREVNGPGQTSLFNVLKAYSIHDPDIGYCQGIAFVVGPLLLNMPEEESFCVLVQLMREYGFRDLYSPKLIGLQMRIYQYEKLLEEKFPNVAKHLSSIDIKANMYASQWFMTLFAYRFPLEMVFRIMDIVFAEGYDAVLRFSLALIQKNQENIIATTEFEAILDFLQNGLFDEYIGDIDALIYDASQIRVSKQRLDKLAQEHTEQIRLTSPDYIEAETLRAENIRLLDRVKFLEGDYETLNREHAVMATEMIETRLALDKSNDRIEELEGTVEGLKSVLAEDRRAAEDQVRAEMDLLAQKNVKLTQHNAELEEEVMFLQNLLAKTQVQYAEAESAKDEIFGRLESLKKALG